MSLKAFQEAFYDLMLGSCDWTCPPEALSEVLNTRLREQVPSEVAALLQRQPVERLRQYQWMVFGNLLDTLETVYPFTHQLLRVNTDWETLVREFLRAYPPRSFQLYHCVTAFPAFLKTRTALMSAFPFLDELATYEVLEADLLRRAEDSSDENIHGELFTNPADLLAHYAPVINSVAEPLECRYPIHTIIDRLKAAASEASTDDNAQINPQAGDYSLEFSIQPEPLALWAYRDRHFACRFFQVNPLTLDFLKRCRALSPLPEAGATRSYPGYGALLRQSLMALALPHTETPTEESEQQFGAFIHRLVQLDILRGHVKIG